MEDLKRMIIEKLESQKGRSAWARGVNEYAIELLEENESINFDNARLLERSLLNGADDWSHFSWGGCSHIYDEDIAERLCTKSELKRKDGGRLKPNNNEEWLDVQARALYQAYFKIKRIYNNLKKQS